MQNRVHASRTPTILYVGFIPGHGIDLMRLAGLRRYAATRGWNVETLDDKDCSPKTLRDTLARLRPIGCVSNYCDPIVTLRPALFGRVPVVYFNTPDRPGWRNARRVECDEAAVAKMAFAELSSTNPPAYAAVSFWENERWARERIDAFRECCRNAGADCQTWHFPAVKNDDELLARAGKMVPWAAALPHRCAVFAVNDWCAHCVARAMSRAGRSFPRTTTLVGADGTEPLPLDKELAETVSSVRLDFELAGYLAARLLAERAITNRSKRGMTTAAAAANDKIASLRGSAAPVIVAKGDLSLPENPASTLAASTPPSAIFPPLLVDRRKSTRGYGRREPRILEAVEMIRREACDGLTAEKLAKRFRGTRRLFYLRFREAMGHPPLNEILNVRMARALDLLANTDMPINAVADFCGFQRGWELWDLFRKRVGMPPLRFRKLKRQT